MTVQPSEANTYTGPCLFGVPVPARVFGFAPGWYRYSERCASPANSADQTVIDLTGSHDTAALIQAEIWSTGFSAATGRVVPLKRTAGPSKKHMTTESEVVAA